MDGARGRYGRKGLLEHETETPGVVTAKRAGLMTPAMLANLNALSAVIWQPLTNGDPDAPELVFADGDVIMVGVPA